MWFVWVMAALLSDAPAKPAADTPAAIEQANLLQLLTVRRVYVDRLTGGETARM
jgi:hypothetical protein